MHAVALSVLSHMTEVALQHSGSTYRQLEQKGRNYWKESMVAYFKSLVGQLRA